MGHNYHPACGCCSCCKIEEAAERAAEAAAPYIAALKASWSVLSEAMGELSDDEMREMAAALTAGNDTTFAAIMRNRVKSYVADKIADRMDDRGLDMYEAASSLAEIYEVGMPAADLRAAA